MSNFSPNLPHNPLKVALLIFPRLVVWLNEARRVIKLQSREQISSDDVLSSSTTTQATRSLKSSCHSLLSQEKIQRIETNTATMHSTIVRGQNVFGFFTTVCFVVAGLIAASDLLAPRTPKATVSVKDLQVYAYPHLPMSTPHKLTPAKKVYEADHITTLPKKKNTP